MSAETVPGPPLVNRVTWHIRGRPGDPLTAELARRQRTPTPLYTVDELCTQMATLCESAVDPLEIVAGLEAVGLGDPEARTRYGLPDVFALATEMYRRVPRRPVEPQAQPELWRARPGEHILHGLLYALPGVCFPAAAPLLTGTAACTALVVAILVSWGLSQGLSYLGYSRLGRSDPSGVAWVLSRGMIIGLLMLLGTLTATSLIVPVQLPSLGFAAGQGAYLVTATVLMVTGAERWLVLTLAPGVLASAGFLLLGRPSWLEHPVWWALAGSMLFTLVMALARTACPAPVIDWPLMVRELRAAVPHALFGVLAAGLLAFPVVAAGLTPSGGRPEAILAMLPLSLSMGAAEWNLYWYRLRISRLLRTTRNLRRFALCTRFVLLVATLRYLLAAALLIVVTVCIATATGIVAPELTIRADCAYLMLGGALFVALLLQAVGGDLTTLLACAVALGVEMVLVIFGQATVMGAQLMACTGLMIVLLLYAGIVLGRAMRHTW